MEDREMVESERVAEEMRKYRSEQARAKLAREVAREQRLNAINNQPAQPAFSTRVKILAGSHSVGATLNDHTIVSLGKSWTMSVSDDDACVYGLTPSLLGNGNQNVTVQYAYLK